MAYTPTVWKTGDVITAEKMNKLEEGVQNEQVGPRDPPGKLGQQVLPVPLVLLLGLVPPQLP